MKINRLLSISNLPFIVIAVAHPLLQKKKFNSGFLPKLIMSRAEIKARELIWLRDHDAAYERANQEALNQLNRCEVCNSYVCDDCAIVSNEFGGRICCKKCNDMNFYKFKPAKKYYLIKKEKNHK